MATVRTEANSVHESKVEPAKKVIAKEDGKATVKVYPSTGENPVEIKRKIVAGDKVPAWLAGEGDVDVGVKTEEQVVGEPGRGYTRNGEADEPLDRKSRKLTPAPQLGMSEDELAEVTAHSPAQQRAKEQDELADSSEKSTSKPAAHRGTKKA